MQFNEGNLGGTSVAHGMSRRIVLQRPPVASLSKTAISAIQAETTHVGLLSTMVRWTRIRR